MRRAKRLFQMMQLLRRDRTSTIAHVAAELEVTVGTLYRDIAYIMAAGVPIEGEAGAGYRLSQPINLPPEIAHRLAELRQTQHTIRLNRIQGADSLDASEPAPMEPSLHDHRETKTTRSD